MYIILLLLFSFFFCSLWIRYSLCSSFSSLPSQINDFYRGHISHSWFSYHICSFSLLNQLDLISLHFRLDHGFNCLFLLRHLMAINAKVDLNLILEVAKAIAFSSTKNFDQIPVTQEVSSRRANPGKQYWSFRLMLFFWVISSITFIPILLSFFPTPSLPLLRPLISLHCASLFFMFIYLCIISFLPFFRTIV